MQRKQPLYLQLKENLLAAIASGELAPGDQLPSQRDLCKHYGMSHMTVRRVINDLMQEGAIYSISGKGLYVAERKQPAEINSLTGFAQNMARVGMIASTQVLDAAMIRASASITRALGIGSESPVAYLRRLRIASGQPMSISICYLPHDLCPGILDCDFTQHSLFDILTTRYGLRPVGSISTVEAKLADDEQAGLLGLVVPAALLFREQITYAHTGQVIELSQSFIRGDRYHFLMEEGDVPEGHTVIKTCLTPIST